MKNLSAKSLFATLMIFGVANIASAVYFNSPSGNILCEGDNYGNGVSCMIQNKTNQKPALPRPKSCEFDWGDDFGLEPTGKAYMNCISDFPYNVDAPVLGYGKSINGKGWTCTSQTTGMRCVNKSGKGFQLSKAKQTLF